MIEVHLIGYTADLRHLVLDLDDGADGRYRLVVDADLFATVDQLRDDRRGEGLPVGDPEEFLTEEELAELAEAEEDGDLQDDDELEDDGFEDDGLEDDGLEDEPSQDDADRAERDDTSGAMWGREAALFGSRDEDPEPEPVRISNDVRLVPPSPFAPGAGRSTTGTPAPAPASPPPRPEPPPRPDPSPRSEPRREPAPRPEPEPEPDPEPAAVEPKLTPAQIQSLLRSGRSPRVVAREAGTDVAWIERWLPPIMAERTRILDRAQAKRLERPRLGRSRDALGQAVPRNLAAKGVAVDDLVWDVARRKDGRWKVSVRYPYRDRVRTATWTYDPSDDELKPASDLAHELGFSRAKDSPADEASARKRSAAGKKTGRATDRRSSS